MKVRKWGWFDGMEPPLGPTSAPTLSKFIIIIRVANDRNESFLLISHYFILILAYPRHRRRSVDDDGDDFGRFQKDDRFRMTQPDCLIPKRSSLWNESKKVRLIFLE